MIESGSIVELSNNKKYIITDSTIENGSVYYLSLEVDNDTEIPTENDVFFKQTENNTLTPITSESDIDFLKNIFVNKFLSSYLVENKVSEN